MPTAGFGAGFGAAFFGAGLAAALAAGFFATGFPLAAALGLAAAFLPELKSTATVAPTAAPAMSGSAFDDDARVATSASIFSPIQFCSV